MVDFNSHAHVERDLSVKFAGISLANFNSHAHVERDFAFTHMHCHSFISTHTLTWSVTQGRERRIIMTKISTHTLTWSVTYSSCRRVIFKKFQLTRSRGA
nr:MAG TPA: hypothetical protein [Caudoviricetes sp.]